MSIRESRFGRLTGHFFAGFLENDLLVSSGTGLSNLLSQLIGVLAVPGLFYTLALCSLKYGGQRYPLRDMMAWEDRLLFLHCAMVVAGLLAVIQWDALFPDRRDYQILTPLPIPARLVFLAKISSVMLLMTIVWAAGNLATAVLFPCIAMSSADSSLDYLRAVFAHLAATFGVSAFMFLLFAGLQGVLLNLLNPKWFRRVAVYVQIVAVLVLVLSFFAGPVLVALAIPSIKGNNPRICFLPSFWFLGLCQELVGRSSPALHALAGFAMKGLGITFVVTALAYFASYRRHIRKSLESLGADQVDPGLVASAMEGALHVFVLRHPLERGHFHFILATLKRSRMHKLVLAACFAVGFALVLGLVAAFAPPAGHGGPNAGLLSVQLVLSFLILCGMRFAFALPAELPANWVFQAADPAEKRHCAVGVRKAMLAFGAAPVLLALFPLHWLIWDVQTAAAHLAYGALLSALAVELLMLRFDKLPFTCSYLPGRSNLKALWAAYLVVFWSYAWLMARLELGLMARPARLAGLCLAAVAATKALRWYGDRRFVPGYQFVFEDLPDPAVRTLDISYGARHDAGQNRAPAEPDVPSFGPPSETYHEPAAWAVVADWVHRFAAELKSDLCYAARMLTRNPGFTFGAVAILTLSIGANTLMFIFFNAWVLKPLPITDPQRNYELTAREVNHRPHDKWSYSDYSRLRARSNVFSEMYGCATVEIPVREPSPRKLKGALVSGNYFRIFNAGMVLGRGFGPDEDAVPGRDAVVVLSDHVWRGIFHSDPAIIGKSLRIRERFFTIVGVTEPSFSGADPVVPDLWAPIVMREQVAADPRRITDPENAWISVGGLLKPGVSTAQAQTSVFSLVMGLNAEHPAAVAIDRLKLKPRATYLPLVDEALIAATCLVTVFGLVLLVACANLAGILLARGAARQRELSIRASIGASRGRLVRQLLTESVLLGAIAAVPTLLLTVASINAVQRYICTWLIKEGFYVQPISPDWRAFVFTALLALATGILLGLAPALEATRADLTRGLKEAGSPARNSRPRRIRDLLVVGQVAGSLVLLVVAGIFIRNAQRVHRIEPGFDVEHVIDMRADGPKLKLMERLQRDPRVEAMSEVYRVPLRGHLFPLAAKVEGEIQVLGFHYVDARFFETIGLPIRRGRSFTAQEARAQALLVVVSEAAARMLWTNRDPLGKTIQVLPPRGGERWVGGNYDVVGVVPDAVTGLIAEGRAARYPTIYLATPPGDPRNGGLIVRTRDASAATLVDLRKLCGEVEAVGACEPITLGQTVRDQRFGHVITSTIASGLGGLSLFMACIGLYGVVAFAVVQRTREIGVRMALGATAAGVLRMMIFQSMRRVALGIVLGLPVCFAFSKLAARVFYTSSEIRTFDLAAYITTPLYLALVTMLAAYIPARRATRIDPMSALRQD